MMTSSPGRRRHAELVDDERAQVVRHGGVDGEMDRHAAAAALQRGLVGADEVLRLFLELHAGVADQPEQPAAVHLKPGNSRSRNRRTRSSSSTKRTAAVALRPAGG